MLDTGCPISSAPWSVSKVNEVETGPPSGRFISVSYTHLDVYKRQEYGRIDMPSAKAFLARMYLYNEQLDEAADMASQVIDGSYGLELSSSLKDLWDDSKRNKEFIWTTEFVEDESFKQPSYYWQHFAMFIDRFAGVQTECGWTGYGGCGAVHTLYYLS